MEISRNRAMQLIKAKLNQDFFFSFETPFIMAMTCVVFELWYKPLCQFNDIVAGSLHMDSNK